MSDKDEIRDLFQEGLKDYQVKVSPRVWEGVQAGIVGGTATVAGGISLVTKILIGIGVAGIAIGSFILLKTSEKENIVELTQQETVEQTEDSIQNQKEIEEENVQEKITQNEVTTLNAPIIDDSELINFNPTNSDLGEDDYTNTGNDSETIPFSIDNIIPSSTNTNSSTTPNTENTEKDSKTVDLSSVEIVVLSQDNQFVHFKANSIPEGASLFWDFGDGDYDNTTNPEHFFNESGTYSVVLTVKYENQEIKQSKSIKVSVQGFIGELPNIITPNNDGMNDELFIESKNLKSFQITIMDNAQNTVFISEDPNFRWNGTNLRGESVENGQYIYIIIAEDDAGNLINKYQHLTVKR